MKRKLVFLILSIIMAASLLLLFACSGDEETLPPEIPPEAPPAIFVVSDGVITSLTDEGRKVNEFDIPSVIDGETITGIGDEVFMNNTIVTTVKMPNTITSIGENAFSGCDRMTSLTLSTSLLTVGEFAFFNCNKLTEIVIPKSLKVISRGMFKACSRAESITIPEGVTTISDEAFAKCNKVTSIHIPSSVTTISPESIDDSGVAFSDCRRLTTFTVAEENEHFSALDGNLYNKDKTELIHYAIGKEQTTFTVPNGVKYLREYAFGYSKKLISVTLSSSVERIGYACFTGCDVLENFSCGGTDSKLARMEHRTLFGAVSLKTLELPKTLYYVGKYALSYCSQISKITYYGTPDDWNKISLNDNYVNQTLIEYK